MLVTDMETVCVDYKLEIIKKSQTAMKQSDCDQNFDSKVTQLLTVYIPKHRLIPRPETYPTINGVNSSSIICEKILKTSFLSERPIIVHINPSVCHV